MRDLTARHGRYGQRHRAFQDTSRKPRHLSVQSAGIAGDHCCGVRSTAVDERSIEDHFCAIQHLLFETEQKTASETASEFPPRLLLTS